MAEHKIDLEHDRSGGNSNLHTATPVCSCGWRGRPVMNYEDDQMYQLWGQEVRHLRNARYAAT